MKRVILSLLAGIALLAAPSVKADNITVDQARDAAAYYLRCNSDLARIAPEQLTLAHQWNNESLGVASMYLFTAPETGWIIMAGTTVMAPVVGYADNNVIDLDNMAPQLAWWLSAFNELVCEVQDADAVKPLDDSPEWVALTNHSFKGSKARIKLMDEKWNQGNNRGTDYNMLCPVVNDTVCPTGCVATALAQICHYYGYPKSPTGKPSYFWKTGNQRLEVDFDTVEPLAYGLMPNEIKSNSTQAERREVSRLGYFLGLSLRMNYDASGSGTTSDRVVPAMQRYMKYSLGSYVSRQGINDTHFLNSVRRELLLNRPVYMDGSSSTGSGAHAAGHAWVCDGYQDNDDNMFHINWGWGGSGNGWFNLVTNNMAIPSMGYNFSVGQSIVIGMIPPQDSTDRVVGVREVEPAVVLGMPYPNPAALSVVLPYSCDENAVLQVYSVSGRLVENRRLQAGSGEVVLDVDMLPAGIYIYRAGNAYGKFVVRK